VFGIMTANGCYHDAMRTTVTLDPDVQTLLKNAMRKADKSFKQVLNDGLRAGLSMRPAPKASSAWEPMTFDMGVPLVDLTKANALAGELEDQELIARMQRRA
jgi:hypothetical protein